eukprot:1176679-Prorocentrum_minimum.AAC.2
MWNAVAPRGQIKYKSRARGFKSRNASSIRNGTRATYSCFAIAAHHAAHGDGRRITTWGSHRRSDHTDGHNLEGRCTIGARRLWMTSSASLTMRVSSALHVGTSSIRPITHPADHTLAQPLPQPHNK